MADKKTLASVLVMFKYMVEGRFLRFRGQELKCGWCQDMVLEVFFGCILLCVAQQLMLHRTRYRTAGRRPWPYSLKRYTRRDRAVPLTC